MISVVMAYYNRAPHTKHTLKTISKSKKFDECEIVLVNDFSPDIKELEPLTKEYKNFRIINMQDFEKEKWYMNPCIPYNVGFYVSEGEKIIIQNPECCHQGDILDDVYDNLNQDIYISYATLSILETQTKKLWSGEPQNLFSNRSVNYEGEHGWYNHSVFRPCHYHFCSAITRENLKKLNGFDERYAKGFAFDDNEILLRIDRLGLQKIIKDSPMAIHQHHYSSGRVCHPQNGDLYNSSKKETIIYAEYNKRKII